MPRILVTNDDGVRSPGIAALTEALAPLGDVWVVAPLCEQSGVSHALTIRRPLCVMEIEDRRRWYSVDGTPTDCVYMAVGRILDGVPDLLVSGINIGWNLGDDVTYSGTVAAALEGTLLGAPSLAVSQRRVSGAPDFSQAAATAAQLAATVLETGLPPGTLLNVNLPEGESRGLRATWQARLNQKTPATRSASRKRYYWVGAEQRDWETDPCSDYRAVLDGWTSVTPLQTDWTAHGALDAVEALFSRSAAEAG